VPFFPREQPLTPNFPSKLSGTVPADLELVARCRAGDAAAFEELYRRHAARLYNLAHRMLGNAADAEDLLQETFLLAHRKLDGFKGESALSTWLYRLATNLCLDLLRSRAGKARQLTDPLDERHGAEPAGAHDRRGELIVDRLNLERAILELPDGCRAAFVLHDVEGFDHREVGRILGISDGTSKSQVHKARSRLRLLLKRRAGESSGPER
jgi:RNA polymerase sigma-70 factor, ECF subfamily